MADCGTLVDITLRPLESVSLLHTILIMAFKLAVLSIPAYHMIAIIPHIYAQYISMQGTAGRLHNNNPRSVLITERLRKTLPPQQFAKWERAKASHYNTTENAPLFVATIFACLLAEQQEGADQTGADTFAIAYVLLRALFVLIYCTTETERWSYVRSFLFTFANFWAFVVLCRSAKIISDHRSTT